jgi:hypothetical protein
MDSGLTTIENARNEYNNTYNRVNPITKVKLKCWINHSESRHRNNHEPYTFNTYQHCMRTCDLVEQINLNMIDISDLFDGDKDKLIEYIKCW